MPPENHGPNEDDPLAMLAGRAKVETYQDVTVDEADSEEEVDTTAEAKNMVQQGWDLAKQMHQAGDDEMARDYEASGSSCSGSCVMS